MDSNYPLLAALRTHKERFMSKTTLGVIVGNRGFFPDSVARDGRNEILTILAQLGFDVVCLTPEDSKFGTVETFADSKACASLFSRHADKIDGILVTLPNFGDERGVANAIRLSGLKVPVLIHAYPDELKKFAIGQRRDSFCGKFSVCSNLSQYNIPFTLTAKHTVWPSSASFKEDLRRFGGTCRVVRGLKNSRFGAIGARPAPFNSVRYSEKLLEYAGITVDVVDLSDMLGRASRLKDSDPKVKDKLAMISKYAKTNGAPEEALYKMAKFGVVTEDWMTENGLVGSAIQCWTSMQENFGIVPCTIMSMMGNGLAPSACEVDVAGVIGMYVLQLASGKPSAIVDWNNNYEDDEDKCVLFHCANFPKDFYDEMPAMDAHAILGNIMPASITWGSLQGRIKAGPVTFFRMSTDDVKGKLTAYVTEGESTTDPADTWGGVGVVRVPKLQELLRYVCENNFEHHVSINMAAVGGSIADALKGYLGWDTYSHHIAAPSGSGRALGAGA
jgi:L-fucose isomerase-like protein